MQKDGIHDAGTCGIPESLSNHHAPTKTAFQPSANMRDRLENLAKWRIDPSSIEFPKEAHEVSGGHATVSQAFLTSPSRSEDSTNQFDPTNNSGFDSGGRVGETSQWGKDVAVKKMKIPDDIKRVLGLTVREAEFLVGLSNENIIKLEGIVEDISKNIVWLVFPWEENGTLRDFVASAEWEIPERISLIFDVAKGVHYLHSRQPPIWHGDLKSLNILVNSKCRALITDFGSARRLKTEELNAATKPAQKKPLAALSLEATFCASTNTITLTGDHYTLRWAAPELLYDEAPGLFSDIWALGWVAYEVMTGFIPFQDVKDTIVIKRVIQGDLPFITSDARMSLIQALCSLMISCWSIDPSKRPTAEDCQKSIEWMPRITPNSLRASGTAASEARSPWLLVQLGNMHRRQGDYANALDFFTKAVDGYMDNGDRKGKVAALVQLGQVHRFRSEYSRAISLYSEALEICTDLDDKPGKASALWGLAEVHRIQGEYDQAVTFYSEALQIFTDISDRQGRAEALWGLAEVHRLRDDYSQAMSFYSEALHIRTDIGDRRGRAEALMGLAQVHLVQSEYSQAITLYSEALQIRTDVGDRQGRASALWGLAEVHRLRKEYSQAIPFYSEALQIHTDIGDRRGRAAALWGLADVHRVRKEYSQAIAFYSEDLQIRTETGDRLGRVQALRGLAEVHRLRNEFSEAITLYSEALKISTDIGDRYGRAYALLRIADVHRDQEDHSDAIRLYTEAAEASEEIGNTQNGTYISNQVARLRQFSNREEPT